MDEAQRLLVCQACGQLILEAVACTDAKQAEALAALFADEAATLGRPARQPPSVGEFDDSFVRMDGRWMIARREVRLVLQAAF